MYITAVLSTDGDVVLEVRISKQSLVTFFSLDLQSE